MSSIFSKLPVEILLQISRELSFSQILSLRLVSRHLFGFINDFPLGRRTFFSLPFEHRKSTLDSLDAAAEVFVLDFEALMEYLTRGRVGRCRVLDHKPHEALTALNTLQNHHLPFGPTKACADDVPWKIETFEIFSTEVVAAFQECANDFVAVIAVYAGYPVSNALLGAFRHATELQVSSMPPPARHSTPVVTFREPFEFDEVENPTPPVDSPNDSELEVTETLDLSRFKKLTFCNFTFKALTKVLSEPNDCIETCALSGIKYDAFDGSPEKMFDHILSHCRSLKQLTVPGSSYFPTHEDHTIVKLEFSSERQAEFKHVAICLETLKALQSLTIRNCDRMLFDSKRFLDAVDAHPSLETVELYLYETDVVGFAMLLEPLAEMKSPKQIGITILKDDEANIDYVWRQVERVKDTLPRVKFSIASTEGEQLP